MPKTPSVYLLIIFFLIGLMGCKKQEEAPAPAAELAAPAAPAAPAQAPMSSSKVPEVPLAPEAPSASEAPPASEALSAAQALQNISSGSVFFEPKKVMKYKKATQVTAVIFRKKRDKVTEIDLKNYVDNYSSVVGKVVPHVGERMLAELTGPTDIFKIEPAGKQIATIDKDQGYNWIWFVTPQKKLDSFLTLTIYLDGERPIRQLTEQIAVERSPEFYKDWIDTFLSFIEKHEVLSALLGSGGLGGILWAFLKKKRII